MKKTLYNELVHQHFVDSHDITQNDLAYRLATDPHQATGDTEDFWDWMIINYENDTWRFRWSQRSFALSSLDNTDYVVSFVNENDATFFALTWKARACDDYD